MAADYSTMILAEPGLVSYWRLGETSGTTAADSKGTNTGTYTSLPALNQAGAIAQDSNKAIQGNGGYVSVPDSASLHMGDVFSIEMWFKFGSLTGLQIMYDKRNAGATDGIIIYKENSTDKIVVQSASAIAKSSSAMDTNWHHLVVTKNGATTKIYIDGVDVTAPVANQTISNTTTALVFGAQSGFTDEVAVYNVALSAATALAHYREGINQFVTPTGIASGEAVGTPTISATATITPSGIPSSEAFGTPTVTLDTPGVVTVDATDVTIDTATLHATVDPNDLETTYYFEFNKVDGGAVRTTDVGDAGSGGSPVAVQAVVSQLASGAQYRFRIVATNINGTAYGSYLTFSSPPSRPPASDLENTMLDALPPWFTTDPDIQGIMHASAREGDFAESRIDELVDQAFPGRAVSLLGLWEMLVQVPIDNPLLDVTTRQDAVLAGLLNLVSELSGLAWQQRITILLGNSWSYVEHDPDDTGTPDEYTVEIVLPFAPDSDTYVRFAKYIREITPANTDIIITGGDGFVLDTSGLDEGVL